MSSRTMWRAAFAAVAVLAFVAAGLAQEKPANVAGKWEMSWQGRQGAQTSTLVLEQSGETLKGTMSGRRGDTPVTGTVKGKDVTITVERETPNGKVTIEYKGTVDGNGMKGTAGRGERTFEWTAKKL
ncbi:MAG: hypothetical protein ACRD5G_03860 [Candidatus Acidiferrales bacterium]